MRYIEGLNENEFLNYFGNNIEVFRELITNSLNENLYIIT